MISLRYMSQAVRAPITFITVTTFILLPTLRRKGSYKRIVLKKKNAPMTVTESTHGKCSSGSIAWWPIIISKGTGSSGFIVGPYFNISPSFSQHSTFNFGPIGLLDYWYPGLRNNLQILGYHQWGARWIRIDDFGFICWDWERKLRR